MSRVPHRTPRPLLAAKLGSHVIVKYRHGHGVVELHLDQVTKVTAADIWTAGSRCFSRITGEQPQPGRYSLLDPTPENLAKLMGSAAKAARLVKLVETTPDDAGPPPSPVPFAEAKAGDCVIHRRAYPNGRVRVFPRAVTKASASRLWTAAGRFYRVTGKHTTSSRDMLLDPTPTALAAMASDYDHVPPAVLAKRRAAARKRQAARRKRLAALKNVSAAARARSKEAAEWLATQTTDGGPLASVPALLKSLPSATLKQVLADVKAAGG